LWCIGAFYAREQDGCVIKDNRTKDGFFKTQDQHRPEVYPLHIATERENQDSVNTELHMSSMDGYKIVKYLDEGGFGQVVLAQTRITKQVSTGLFSICKTSLN